MPNLGLQTNEWRHRDYALFGYGQIVFNKQFRKHLMEQIDFVIKVPTFYSQFMNVPPINVYTLQNHQFYLTCIVKK